MNDTDWLQRFDIEFLHGMAESHPATRQEWEKYVPAEKIPWPGEEALRENRALYQRAHDERRQTEACARCES